jgi:hypothetical protein
VISTAEILLRKEVGSSVIFGIISTPLDCNHSHVVQFRTRRYIMGDKTSDIDWSLSTHLNHHKVLKENGHLKGLPFLGSPFKN